jgi:hypothetical protein
VPRCGAPSLLQKTPHYMGGGSAKSLLVPCQSVGRNVPQGGLNVPILPTNQFGPKSLDPVARTRHDPRPSRCEQELSACPSLSTICCDLAMLQYEPATQDFQGNARCRQGLHRALWERGGVAEHVACAHGWQPQPHSLRRFLFCDC